MSRQCYNLTTAELAEYLANGYTQVSGPHDTQGECEAACEGGTVTVECCENPLPTTLYGTFSNKTGDASTCIPGDSVTFELIPSSETQWSSSDDPMSDPCFGDGSGTQFWNLHCDPDNVLALASGFYVENTNHMIVTATQVSFSCDPFELVIDIEFSFSGDPETGTYRITITETAP